MRISYSIFVRIISAFSIRAFFGDSILMLALVKPYLYNKEAKNSFRRLELVWTKLATIPKTWGIVRILEKLAFIGYCFIIPVNNFQWSIWIELLGIWSFMIWFEFYQVGSQTIICMIFWKENSWIFRLSSLSWRNSAIKA